MLRRALVLSVAAAIVVGCAGRRPRQPDAPMPGAWAPVPGMPGPDGPMGMGGLHTLAERGEQILASLPWKPDVLRANLAANGPVSLVQVYLMSEDLLCVDTQGKIYCLSRRDLTPRWISTLHAPLAAPPAETPVEYVCAEVDHRGASWLQWFSRRSGAQGDASPARIPYSLSAGVSATASTAYVGSMGGSMDNKTVQTLNLADGSPGWGWRTLGRVVATPTVDPSGTVVIVASEDNSVISLPAGSAGEPPLGPLWEAQVLGPTVANPVLTRDWAFIASKDNFLRCFDLHSGSVRWLQGTDAPLVRAPWVVGRTVAEEVTTGGEEGARKVRVERFQGTVYVRNALALFAFDADSGAPVFQDRDAERPLVQHGEWVVTLDTAKGAQLRRGKGLPVVDTLPFGVFDLLPTNGRDGSIFAATTDGVVLLAAPK
jgi:outer membrane protein assembly factor BamB